jgi:hypothetical protein
MYFLALPALGFLAFLCLPSLRLPNVILATELVEVLPFFIPKYPFFSLIIAN